MLQKLSEVLVKTMWEMVADGSADGMVSAWLPTTHLHYLETYKDKVEDLGPNFQGTRVGLVVPDYVTINSLAELNANADKFGGKIYGIDPDAGLMHLTTTEAIPGYGLDKFELVAGSEADTMIPALESAIKDNKWVVVTGWTPHWMFARWNLKYLEDPKNVYGQEEQVNTIVRSGLKEQMPEVYSVLDSFHWSPQEAQELMEWNQEGNTTPYQNAQRWVREHRDVVDTWVMGSLQARATYDMNTGKLNIPAVDVFLDGKNIGVFKVDMEAISVPLFPLFRITENGVVPLKQ